MAMSAEQAAEVERLEAEARAKAAKHVANMLARCCTVTCSDCKCYVS